MIPKTKHRDHDIEFDPRTEEWKCGALMLSDKSLSSLQKAIDRESKKRRRVSVEAYFLDEQYRGNRYVHEVLKCSIALLKDGDRNAYIKLDSKREQKLVSLRELYPLDQKTLLDAYVEAKNRAAVADADASEIQDKLSPYSAEGVREAVVQKADQAA